MAANNTKKAMRSMQRQPAMVTPIGTEIILPNSSDTKAKLEMRGNSTIYLETDRPTSNAYGLIRLKYDDGQVKNKAKAIIAFVDETDREQVWLQAHDWLNDSTQHKHFSVEVADAAGNKQTRLSVGYGADVVTVNTNNADFEVHGDNGVNIIEANYTTNLKFNPNTTIDMYPQAQTTRGLRVNDTGSNISLGVLGSSTLQIDDNVLIGASSFTQTAVEEIALNSTATSGSPYGLFVTGSHAPTSASTASPNALGFTINCSGSQTLNGNASGINAVVEHSGSGTLTQATGATFLVKKSSTGPVTTAYGLNAVIQNTNATGAITTGIALNIGSPTATGAITTNFGQYIANQGSANITNSAGIFIQNQSGSSGINLAVYIEGGLFMHNVNQNGTSDFMILGDTDGSLFVADTSADTVQIGAATTSDSAKFYVAGKISTSGELEVNGDLNHDGSNVGFYGTTPVAKPTVTGSRGGNAALASLLTALANLGLITDSSSA